MACGVPCYRKGESAAGAASPAIGVARALRARPFPQRAQREHYGAGPLPLRVRREHYGRGLPRYGRGESARREHYGVGCPCCGRGKSARQKHYGAGCPCCGRGESARRERYGAGCPCYGRGKNHYDRFLPPLVRRDENLRR